MALDGRDLPPIPAPVLSHLSVMVDLGRGRPLSQMDLLRELKECKAAHKKVRCDKEIKSSRYTMKVVSFFTIHDHHLNIVPSQAASMQRMVKAGMGRIEFDPLMGGAEAALAKMAIKIVHPDGSQVRIIISHCCHTINGSWHRVGSLSRWGNCSRRVYPRHSQSLTKMVTGTWMVPSWSRPLGFWSLGFLMRK